MCAAGEAFAEAARQDFAAPDAAVIAVAGAVEADADDACVPGGVLGEHRGDVRAMMLHGDVRLRWQRLCEHGGTILGMRIVCDDQRVGRHVVHPQEIGDRALEGLLRAEVVEVAEVLAHECLAVDDQRNAVLEIGPNREHRFPRWERRHRRRRVAARAAQHDGAARADAHDRVVDASRDRPLADQYRVRDLRQPRNRILIFVCNRLAGAIGARHHEQLWRAVREQQVVQRRVRQHHAEVVVVRRDASQCHLCATKHDRPRDARQQRPRFV